MWVFQEFRNRADEQSIFRTLHHQFVKTTAEGAAFLKILNSKDQRTTPEGLLGPCDTILPLPDSPSRKDLLQYH